MYCSPFYPVSLKIDEKAGDRPPMRFQNRSILNKSTLFLLVLASVDSDQNNNNSKENRQNFYENALETISII